MCGSKSCTFSLHLMYLLRREKHAVLRAAHFSLPVAYYFLQHRSEGMQLKAPHVLCLSTAVPHSTGQRTCGSKNCTFSASCIGSPVRQERKHAVRSHVLPESHSTENVWFFEAHVFCLLRTLSCETGGSLLSCTISHKTGQKMCGSKNLALPACRVPYPTKQEREHGVLRTSLAPSVAYYLP